jgi:hypothetical protein
MMGERDPQKQLWSYQVNLDKRVRSDHPLRRINETLELDFVRREVAKFYGTKGNVFRRSGRHHEDDAVGATIENGRTGAFSYRDQCRARGFCRNQKPSSASKMTVNAMYVSILSSEYRTR